MATPRVRRLSHDGEPMMVPQLLAADQPGFMIVDATWGTIQPLELAPGVRTLGELEVIERLTAGLLLVDSREPHFYAHCTIPGARNIPHPDVVQRRDELAPGTPTVFFCNGPQCTATPNAAHALLDAGHPAELILYYRGGMHDWLTLGLQTVAGHDQPGAPADPNR
ncbi:MAG: rhodanese-like domain-containing protein [Actinomycetota bacterium]|nr:rhodanese-like domain-containing protein [Actinomycetota bacterium]